MKSNNLSDSGQVARIRVAGNVLDGNAMATGTGIDTYSCVEQKGDADGSGIIT